MDKYTHSELDGKWVLDNPLVRIYLKSCVGKEMLEIENRLSSYFPFEFDISVIETFFY